MSDSFNQKTSKKLRGVNLGGWLVLEKWMTPSLFSNLTAEDETSWCLELGERAEQTLRNHWESFIQHQDFAWLSSIGINAVRIPVGHWIFGADYPYHSSYGGLRYPYVTGGIAILDKAFEWAEEFGLKVVLDLHAAPGCQNGFDNGGIKDVCEWHTLPEYKQHSLKVLATLAERYRQHPSLHAIEVLNEPRWDISSAVLMQYTQEAYWLIRNFCKAKDVAVVFHDGFRSYLEYQNFMQQPEYENVILDIHRYQCFVQEDVDTDIYGHISKAVQDWKKEADEIIQNSGWCSYVGEWSLGLNPKMLNLWALGCYDYAESVMDGFQLDVAYRAYAAAQLSSFEKYLGWFFWSYKTEDMPHWSFRDCVAKGWLPGNFS